MTARLDQSRAGAQAQKEGIGGVELQGPVQVGLLPFGQLGADGGEGLLVAPDVRSVQLGLDLVGIQPTREVGHRRFPFQKQRMCCMLL